MPTTAWGGIYTLSTDGRAVRWAEPVKLELAGNPTNNSGLSPASVFAAVTNGLARWRQASGNRAAWDYWQGTDTRVYEPNSNHNGLSSFYFASQDPSGSAGALSSNTLGLTQVWYDTSSGQILETDVVLNDRDFQFTTNPADTSGYGSGSYPSYAAKTRVFIENVLTHELGHAFGLSHSGHEQSTMLYMEAPEQAHLSCDDQSAIRAFYGTGDAGRSGTLEGQVITSGGQAVFGAHVQALSVERGSVLGAAITLADGRFRIAALEPGDYVLVVEPFAAGASVLPNYYRNARTNVCPSGRSFARTIPMGTGPIGNGMEAKTYSVRAGSVTSTASLTVTCPSSYGAAVSGPQGGSSSFSAPVIYSSESGRSRFTAVDRFAGGSVLYYRLAQVSGRLQVRIASHSLYSPVQAVPRLLTTSGAVVSQAQVAAPRDRGASGSAIWDTEIAVDGLATGDYILELTPSAIGTPWFPGGSMNVDAVPFFIVTGVTGSVSTPLADWYPAQARCRQNESYGNYQSPAGDPPRHGVGGGILGFCARVQDVNGGQGPGGGGSPSYGDIASGFLPWVLMAWMARRARKLASLPRPALPLGGSL